MVGNTVLVSVYRYGSSGVVGNTVLVSVAQCVQIWE